MKELVEVKKCCWICRHFIVNLVDGEAYCKLGIELDKIPLEYVCDEFVLNKGLYPKEGVKNESETQLALYS